MGESFPVMEDELYFGVASMLVFFPVPIRFELWPEILVSKKISFGSIGLVFLGFLI